MVFSSFIFVFGFLPPLLILGFLSHKWVNIQNTILLLASLLFYTWGEPEYIGLFVTVIWLNWLSALIAEQIRKPLLHRSIGTATIFFDILILFWFKYAGWIGNAVGLHIGSGVLPIGISFYIFQAISYVADVTLLDKYRAEKNPIHVGIYIAFFPQLIAGPIVRYEEMKDQIRNRRMTIDCFEEGCFRFILGFCKKVLLADSMAIIVNKAFSAGLELTCSFAWLGAVAYTFQIFMDFSGYSDMAIGLGSMFGFRIPENFHNPYRAGSIRDFWRRWHITLSIWFRDYVYIPLGGNRKEIWRTTCNIAIVWMLTGFWHGANFTFVLWGMIYGCLVLLEKALSVDEILKKSGGVLRRVYRLFTLLAILFLWVLFRAENLSCAIEYIRQMLHFRMMPMDKTILYLSEFKWAMLICAVLSAISDKKIMKNRDILWPGMLMIFIVSISYLVKGTFSPFLYFNF